METKNQTLYNLSPIDGRYANKTHSLSEYFSEYGLIKYRLRIEIVYFITLCRIPLPQLKEIDTKSIEKLHEIYTGFSFEDALAIKEIEKITNHDVKALEYFIKDKFKELGLQKYAEFYTFWTYLTRY